MSIKIKSISKMVEESGLKILVHGLSGSGKTVLCCTTGEPTLIISAESGLLSVKSAPKYIKGVEIENIGDLEDIYQYLAEQQDEPPFKWVALDSITEIAERILSIEKENNRDPRKAYMDMQDRVMILLRKFRDLKNYNVIMSCKQERKSDDSGGPAVFVPMMPGQKLSQALPYLFDEVFALRVEKDENGEVYRVLQTGRDNRFDAKDRSGLLGFFEKPSIKHIYKKIHGEPEIETEKEESKTEHKQEETQEPVEQRTEPKQIEIETENEEIETIETE